MRTYYTVVPSFTGESIPVWFMFLGLVVFSNIIYYLFIIYLFIINDVILTAFRIILTTWLYNYFVSLVYSPRLPFFHDKNYTALLTESFRVSMTH